MTSTETTQGIGNILADSQGAAEAVSPKRSAKISAQLIRPKIREYTVGPGRLPDGPLATALPDAVKGDLCDTRYNGVLPESGEPTASRRVDNEIIAGRQG